MTAHPFGHIACWADGPPAGSDTLRTCLALRGAAGGRLSLLHGGPGRRGDPEARARDWRRRRGEELPGVEPVFLEGEQGAAVSDWAREREPDVLVVDVRAGRLPGLEAGGFVDHLLERAPCHVLVLRGPLAGTGGAGVFGHVGCCVDGAPADALALRVARGLCGEGARLSLVHVARRSPWPDAAGGAPVGAGDDLAGAEPVLLEGPPGPALCAWADDAGCDLLVVSSRHPGRWGMSVLGGVTRHLVDHAPCPVLAVRRDDERPPADRS